MIYTLVTAYLTAALVFQGLDITKAAAITLFIKIWDAVNDAIFGCIFDKVRFKSGEKFIPWLKISLFAIPITTVLLFAMPKNTGEMFKLVWYAVTYMLWDTAYTLCDVPIYGFVTAMTERIDERTALQSYKSIMGGVGTGLATIMATVLISEQVGSNYFVISIVVSVVALLTMIPVCKTGKERCAGESDQAFTLKVMFKYLVSNKYLLLYYLGVFFQSSANIVSALNLWVSYYLFHNTLFSMVVMILSAAPSLIFSLLVPKLVEKFDKMKIYLTCNILTVLLSFVMWLCGYNSMIVFIIISVLRAIPQSITGVMYFMFTPDCAEYGRFKTGTDAKGITFAIQTFMVKLTAAISSALSLYLLGVIGWKDVSQAENFQQLEVLNISQSASTLDGLWFIYVMVPAIGIAVSTLIWSFYKLNDHDVELMTKANSGTITREEALSQLKNKNIVE
ncbi:MAG: MFS transporter [Oscillospiraceae bacterium]|nr:MFS transporter [Oscillospiraceae bacterium]